MNDYTSKEIMVAAKLINIDPLLYVFVKKEPGTEGAYEYFKQYHPVQDEDGWWFDRKYEHEVAEICKKSRILTYELKQLPLPIPFDEYKRSNNFLYWNEKLLKNDEKIKNLLTKNQIIDNNIMVIDDSLYEQCLLTPGGTELLEERKKIKSGLQRIKNQESIAKIKQSHKTSIRNNITIKFIADQQKNYFTQVAPEAPVLLQVIKGSAYIPFLRKGIVGQLVGAGGIGKTHWLTQLALSVTTGSVFFDIYRVNEPGHVFMGLGENTDDDIHRLLSKHSKNLTPDQKDRASKRLAVMSFVGQSASFIDNNGEPTEMYEKFLNELKSKEPQEGWALLILDPISRFLGSDAEKDNAAATKFIALLERMVLELHGNPTLLFGHHMSKSGLTSTSTDQTAARGSSAITDGVRWQANLDKVELSSEEANKHNEKYDKNKVCFRVVKSNFTAIQEPQMLYKDQSGCLSANEQNGRRISSLK